MAVDLALQELAGQDARTAELVKLHYFAGLTIEQAAEVLGISPRTAYRSWAYARAWLYRRLTKDNSLNGLTCFREADAGALKIRLHWSHSAALVIEVLLRTVATATFGDSDVFQPRTRRRHRRRKRRGRASGSAARTTCPRSQPRARPSRHCCRGWFVARSTGS